MKTRIIHTKFWEDSFIESLSPLQKYLFLYYITNAYIGLTGTYQLSTKRTVFETNLDESFIQNTQKIFQEAGKILFYKDWVILVNSDKHNSNYSSSKMTKIAYKKELESIPYDVIQYKADTISIPYAYGMDMYLNNKSEIRNKKKEIRNKKSEKGSEEYNAFLQGFNEIVGSSYKGTKADKEHFHARIIDGYTLGSLLSATRKASQDKYLMGENDRHRRYLTPEYILRPNKLEEWLNQPESNVEERTATFQDFVDLVNECGNKNFKGSDIAMQQLFNDLDKGFSYAEIGKVVQLAAKDKWVRGENRERIDLFTPEYLTRQTTLERFLNSKKGGER